MMLFIPIMICLHPVIIKFDSYVKEYSNNVDRKKILITKPIRFTEPVLFFMKS